MKHQQGEGRAPARAVSADDPNAQIATRLRSLYLSVQEEAIPDRFLDLLEKLDAVEQGSTKSSNE